MLPAREWSSAHASATPTPLARSLRLVKARFQGSGPRPSGACCNRRPVTPLAVANAVALLASLVDEINSRAPPSFLGADGAPLMAPENCMAAAYAVDGHSRYTPHRDNVRGSGGWLNDRVLTLICYCNDDWGAVGTANDRGGALRIHPHAPDDDITPEGEWVDIAPRAGTVAIFKSDLLHEVRPCAPCADADGPSHRMALTMWALARRAAS